MTDQTPNSVFVADAARLLYGSEWKPALATDLGLGRMTVQRIAEAAEEEMPVRVPDTLLDELGSRLVEHAELCLKLASKIAEL